MSIEAYTAQRLQGYDTPNGSPFSAEVIDLVSEIAAKQASYGQDYGRFLTDADYPGTQKLLGPNGLPYEVADFRRKDECDEVLVYHLPMANPLDSNQLYQIATVAEALPHTRVVAVGNPSGGINDSGRLTARQRKAVAGGSMLPLVEPTMQYLATHGIEATHQVGYSFGADKAAELTAQGDAAVSTLVTIEPVVGLRGLVALAKAFKSTDEVLAEYTTAPQLDGFDVARRDAIGQSSYARGLMLLSNIAIARSLGHGAFGDRLYDAIKAHPDMETVVAWGSRSELADFRSLDELLIEREIASLNSKLPPSIGGVVAGLIQFASSTNIHGWRFSGERHAMANDIHFQTAIVAQAIEHQRAA